MKTITYIFLLLAFTATSAQNRYVLWAHGINDDADFWDRQYIDAQRNYRIISYSKSHDTDKGVQQYANLLRASSAAIKGSQTIAVGHSMGGVAIRQANKDDNSLYGGMITLGAPLDGAKIANQVIRGETDKFIQQSFDILKSGPIASTSRNLWQKITHTAGAIITFRPSRLKSTIIRVWGSELILDIINRIAEYFQTTITSSFDPKDPSLRDLAENSTYMNGMRSYQSSQPKINAWGNEESPVHIRLLASGLSLEILNQDKIVSAYNTIGNQYKSNADGLRIRGFLRFRKKKNRLRREKEAWNAGADYIRRGWEIAWNELTGARYLEKYTTTQQFYECSGGSSPLQYEADENNNFYNSSRHCRWVERPVTSSRWVNGPSDGLIKKSSQVGQNSKWKGKEVELEKVNHFEMGEHEEVDDFFEDTFGGEHGNFFETKKRN